MSTSIPLEKPDSIFDSFSYNNNDKTTEALSQIEGIKMGVLTSNLSEEQKNDLFNQLDGLRSYLLHIGSEFSAGKNEQRKDKSDKDFEYVLSLLPSNLEIDGILGLNPEISFNLKKIARIAPTNLPVLLKGDLGSGKELFARIIHHNSKREKLAIIDCGAVPKDIIQSEIFGHVRGAFIGASSDKRGSLEKANGSTVFIDKIEELDFQSQSRLLKFLDEGLVQRVGTDRTTRVDIRLIVGSEKSLDELVKQKKFRKDLFYKLNVCYFYIPPLKERKDEIELLYEYFIKSECEETGITKKPEIDDDLRSFLFEDYDFPGNIRELKNLTKYITSIYSGLPIGIKDLSIDYRNYYEKKQNSKNNEEKAIKEVQQKAEKDLLIGVLQKTRGNVPKACKELDLSRSRVYQLIKKYELSPSSFK